MCAGASQRDVVERGVTELGYSRQRLLGTAPEALAGALRAIVAIETDGSPRDVALTVLGIPPDQIVIPWEEATVGGFLATSVIDQATRRHEGAGTDESRHQWHQHGDAIGKGVQRSERCGVRLVDVSMHQFSLARSHGGTRERPA